MRRFCIVLGCIAVIWVWFFYFNASAMTKQEYEQQYFALLSDYQHGYITLVQFQEREDELSSRYLENNTDDSGVVSSIAQNVYNTVDDITNNIGTAVMAAGDSVKDWIDDVLNPYETTETVSSVDTNGYGCLVVSIRTKYNNFYEKAYCEYAVLSSDNIVAVYGDGYVEQYDVKTGNLVNTIPIYANGSNPSYGGTFADNSDYRREVYGDLRYQDGTSAPTNDVYFDQSTYDFSNATDRELDELLNNLNENLKRERPDLSSMEGILESIYYRLGALDSDDDNALLSQVIIAIENLRTDDSDLLLLLEEIRDKLSNDKTIDNTDYQNKILEYIAPGDVSAFEEFSISVSGLFYSKFSFISEFQSFFSSLSWSSPESIVIDFSFMDNDYSIDTSVYNELMPTVRGMLAFFIYGVFCIRCFKRMPAIISGGGDE